MADHGSSRSVWEDIRALRRSGPDIEWHRGEIVVMSMVVNILGLGLPIFMLQVYDRVLPDPGLAPMHILVIGLIGVVILDCVLRTIRSSITAYSGARFEHMARVAAVGRVLGMPQDKYEEEPSGTYLDGIDAIVSAKEACSGRLSTLLIDLPFAVVFLGMFG